MGTRDNFGRTLLDIDEACKFLQTSRATLYRLLRKGVLPRVKPENDRSVYIPLEDLEAYQAGTNANVSDLAGRVLALEKKVELLLARDNSKEPKPTGSKAETVSYTDLQNELRKRHPGLFKN